MSIFSEFKEFALKGSVVDLAVGVIIGGAFGTIVSSLVDDIIMPPIGMALAGIDFSSLKLVLQAAQPAVGTEGAPDFVAAHAEVAIGYGAFLNAVLKFGIIAWVLFMVIKAMNSIKRKEETAPAAPPEPPEEIKLLTEIRDALKKK